MAQRVAQALAVEPVITTRLVLRDGSTAGLRASFAADRDAMRRFFHDLSPHSRRLRFLASAEPSADLIDRLCDNSDPHRAVTLVVIRHYGGDTRLVGVGSYFSTEAGRAEVAFAIDDRFQGKGIATALLERLAVMAADNGLSSFEAIVLAENTEMLNVFRDSGFTIRSKSADGCVDVDLSLTMSSDGAAAADERDRLATIASLKPMFEPRAIAVVGASRNEANLGRRIFDSLRMSSIPIYPVNPAVAQLSGMRCYASARELPSGVDLAVIAVPRDAVSDVIDDCAAAGVKEGGRVGIAFFQFKLRETRIIAAPLV